MNGNEAKRLGELEEKVARLEEQQAKDHSKLIGMMMSFIRPLIAVSSATLQSGILSSEAALEQVVKNGKEEKSDRETIESWAGARSDGEQTSDPMP